MPPKKLTIKTKNEHKGGLKSTDDADIGSDDDYITNSNDDEEDEEENGEETNEQTIEDVKDVNSDDDLEKKDDDEDEADDVEDDESEDDNEETEEVNEDGECIYRFTGKKKKVKDLLSDIEIEDDFFDDDNIVKETFVDPSKRITKKFMTIYERVRILGERAKQISLGAKPLIKGTENLDPKIVAKMELEKKIIPLVIIRPLPNGQKEKWRVSELEIIN